MLAPQQYYPCHRCGKPRRADHHRCEPRPGFVDEAQAGANDGACDWEAKVEGDVMVIASRTPRALEVADPGTRKRRDLLSLQGAGVLERAMRKGGLLKAVDHGLVLYHGAAEPQYLSEYHVRVEAAPAAKAQDQALLPSAMEGP